MRPTARGTNALKLGSERANDPFYHSRGRGQHRGRTRAHVRKTGRRRRGRRRGRFWRRPYPFGGPGGRERHRNRRPGSGGGRPAASVVPAMDRPPRRTGADGRSSHEADAHPPRARATRRSGPGRANRRAARRIRRALARRAVRGPVANGSAGGIHWATRVRGRRLPARCPPSSGGARLGVGRVRPFAERYRSGRNGGASKASCRVTGTWVRIPPSPPLCPCGSLRRRRV